MRQRRFSHTSLVEVIILVVTVVLVAGFTLASQFSGRGSETLGAAASPSATPSTQPSPAAGSIISLPSSASGELTLTSTNQALAFSKQEAMQVVKDFGVPFGLGGVYEGRTVAVSAAYGLGTFGKPGGPGQPWLGDQHIPLKGTNVVLDHVENRPMWILDYDNVYASGSQATFKHAVYAIDMQTRSVLKIWFYEPVPADTLPS